MGKVIECWTYAYDNINNLHTFTHDNYAPDVEDADSSHFKYAYKYGDALNDVLDQEKEWENGR